MKISTKGRYGLRAMVDLAIHSSTGHVSLNAIAQRQDISMNYLEQVFSTLRKAGLVRSVKGAQGGYMLSMPKSQITAGMILRALEGPLVLVDETGNEGTDQSVQRCIKSMVWDVMTDAVNEVADRMTLEDLADAYVSMPGDEAMVYHI